MASDDNSDSSDNLPTPDDLFYQTFTKSNIVLILWFLAIYFTFSVIVRITTSPAVGSGNRISAITRIIDLLVLVGLILYLVVVYFMRSNNEKEDWVESTWDSLTDYIERPLSLVSTGLFLVVLYAIVMLLGIPMDYGNKPITVSFLENGAWLLLAITLIALFFNEILGLSFSEFLRRLFRGAWEAEESKPKVNTSVKGNTVSGNTTVKGNTTVSTPEIKNEVFNISNNVFSYEDAQAVCKVFDSRLATYDEIEEAYKDGGEWCNYGWSDNQSIYFPTQKSTWDKLQKTKLHKNDCGRPGVNGGYIENANARFGVNCYGVKPKATTNDLKFMDAKKNAPVPKTKEEIITDLKVKLFKANREKLLRLNAFNGAKWSEY
jgi:hypothetical protein